MKYTTGDKLPIDKEAILKRVSTPTSSSKNEMGDIVNLIQREIGFTPAYPKGFWLKRCKGKRLTYVEMLIEQARDKKNPGAYLAACLKPKKV